MGTVGKASPGPWRAAQCLRTEFVPVYQVCGLKELPVLSVPQFPQLVEQWHQHHGICRSSSRWNHQHRAWPAKGSPPCAGLALGDPGFLAPSGRHFVPVVTNALLPDPDRAEQSGREQSGQSRPLGRWFSACVPGRQPTLQQQQHPGICQRCTFLAPSPDPLGQNLG